MHCTRAITPSIHWIGANDRRLARFENMFPLPGGISYNSYLIVDDKVALLDAVDSAVTEQFYANVEHVLGGRAIDYLIINHIEPDHGAGIGALLDRHPGMKLVGNKKTFQLLAQFYPFDATGRLLEVTEADTLPLGRHSLRFLFAPMVHWPEVMLTFEQREGILFSADAFGTFGALDGGLFNDEVDFQTQYLMEARRYYTNIVGRFGMQVQAALKKAAPLGIRMICPLHGPIWRSNLAYIMQKYDLWSRYEPEAPGVLVAYASMYGNTQNAAAILADHLAQRGVPAIRMYDVSKTNASYIIADAFQYSHLALAAPTYNNGLYLPMQALLHDMAVLNLQRRKVALIGNGSWVPAAHTVMQNMLQGMKGMDLLAPPLVIRSALTARQRDELLALAGTVADSVLGRAAQ